MQNYACHWPHLVHINVCNNEEGLCEISSTLLGETLSSESDEFFEKWRKFARRIILLGENFARQTFAQQYNHNFSKWLRSLVGSLILHFKTLLILLGKTFRRAKVTNFSVSDENFARRKFRPTKFRPIRYFHLVSCKISCRNCNECKYVAFLSKVTRSHVGYALDLTFTCTL